ncbi:WD40 repeat-like protein, partial [Gyrodon lividus]
GHTDSIRSVTFLPDGKQVISGSDDSIIRAWRVEGGREVGHGGLEGQIVIWNPTTHEKSLAFSPDSARIVSGSGDETVVVWSTMTGERLAVAEWKAHVHIVYSIAVSYNGKFIASGSSDKTMTIRPWDTTTFTQIRAVLQHGDWVYSVAILPDGSHFVSGGDDNKLHMWNITDIIPTRPAPIQEYEGHKRAVDCIAFFPNEKKLVSGSWDGKLLEWDLETGLQCGKWWKGHGDAVSGVDVSRDGRMVVSGGRDRTVIIWDEESGEVVQVLEGHQNEVRSVQFSGDSKRVVSGSDDGTVRVWLIEGELAFEPIKCRGEVTCVRYSPNGDRIASGAESVQIWDAETGNGILSIRDSPVWSFSWTPDSDQIIGGGFRKISVWDSHTGEQTRTWETPYHNTALSLSPHGTHLVTSGSFDKSALLYDITTGERIAAFEHDEKVRDIAYSPSGQLLATACTNKKVYLWAAPT